MDYAELTKNIRASLEANGQTPFDIGRRNLARLWNISPRKAAFILGGLRADWNYENGTQECSPKNGQPIKTIRNSQTAYKTEYISPGKDGMKLGMPSPCGEALNAWKAQKLAEERVETKDTLSLHIPSTRIHTLEDLLSFFEVKLDIWEVERFTCNKWEVGAKDHDGNVQTTPLFQVKAVLKRKCTEQQDAVAQEIEELVGLSESRFRSAPLIIKAQELRLKTGNMVELCIPDLHFNRLVWNGETGHGNWDSHIAREVFDKATDDLFQQVFTYKPEKIVFVIGNDLLNADNIQQTTTRGTPQVCDTHYHKAFEDVRNMKIAAIEKFRALCPVEVITLPGNHDKLASWHLGDSIKMLYCKTPDVTVDTSALPRKYMKWGNCGLCWTHGDEIKRPDLPLTFAAEQRELWGNTKYNEIHLGHLHQTQTQEFHGVRVRILPVLCKPNEWENSRAYIGNIRCAQAYVWNKESGLKAILHYNDPE